MSIKSLPTDELVSVLNKTRDKETENTILVELLDRHEKWRNVVIERRGRLPDKVTLWHRLQVWFMQRSKR